MIEKIDAVNHTNQQMVCIYKQMEKKIENISVKVF